MEKRIVAQLLAVSTPAACQRPFSLGCVVTPVAPAAAFENEGGGRNDSTGAAACIGGDANNARPDVPYPFPRYASPEAFAQKYRAVRGAMAT